LETAEVKEKMEMQPGKYRWYVLMTVFVGTFMAPLDSSIVNIALPTISRHFSVGITTVEWVVMAYLLTTSSLLLSAGRLGDILGHKLIYILGFVTFTVASALCGFSSSIGQLIFFRVVQAVGATCMMATGPAILTDAFPPFERGKALGMIGISVAIGLTIGPFLGGILVTSFDWRWIFFVNIPIGILVSILAVFILKGGRRDKAKRFDFLGSTVALTSLFALLLALSKGSEWGWQSAITLGLISLSIALSGLFVMIEKRAKDPMLDLSLFKMRLFSAANASALINYAALFVVLILIPFYLLDVFNETPQKAGVILTAVPLLTGIISPISGTLSDKIGSRFLSSFGLAITALALFGLSQTSTETGLLPIVLLLSLVGLGSGLFQSPNTSAIMGIVPKHRLGVAAGLQATMRNIGMVLGVAMAGAIVATFAPAGHNDPHLSSAIHLAFTAGAFVAALGVITSLVRGTSAEAQEVLANQTDTPG